MSAYETTSEASSYQFEKMPHRCKFTMSANNSKLSESFLASEVNKVYLGT